MSRSARLVPVVGPLVCVAAALAVASCGHGWPDRAEVIGTYRSDDGAVVTLHEDGAFSIDSVPRWVIDRTAPEAEGAPVYVVSGTWDDMSDSAGTGNSPFVYLMIENGEFRYGGMQLWLADDAVYFMPEGPDSMARYVFESLDGSS